MRHALILAGGSGTRLWPFSTASLPKQLVPMFAGRSLLDIAVDRARAVADEVWLGAGEQLRAAVSSVEGLRADRLILEPSGRDTLPAIALACATIAAADPDAVVAVLTSDHLIEPVDAFAATLSAGFELAESSARTLVTFGVVPDSAATGFGYLELGEPLTGEARVVTRFREKPDIAAARPDRHDSSGTPGCSSGARRRCWRLLTPSSPTPGGWSARSPPAALTPGRGLRRSRSTTA
jgi:mannose-1-phosphate guanylyltransferase